MIRCNMCLDPGLLPVEEDRPRHRLSVHANKLFFCDICEPHEKGKTCKKSRGKFRSLPWIYFLYLFLYYQEEVLMYIV